MDLFVAIWVCEWVLRSAIAKGALPANPSPQQMTQSTAFITGVLGFALGYGVLVGIGRKSDLFNRWFRVLVGFFVAVGIWQQLEAVLDWRNRWAFRLLVFVIFITFAVLVLLFIIRSLGIGALLKPRFIEVALMSIASLIVIASAVFTLAWGWSARKPPGTTVSGGHPVICPYCHGSGGSGCSSRVAATYQRSSNDVLHPVSWTQLCTTPDSCRRPLAMNGSSL